MSSPSLSPLPKRVNAAFFLSHPAHWLAMGGGSGLSPIAPGTVGTLWAWVSFLVLQRWVVAPMAWAGLLTVGFAVGWWACKVCAERAAQADPGFIVWDEVLAFWLVLWLIAPAGWGLQLIAFALFRWFDAAKPGPVRWADRAFKGNGWRGAFGILVDDLVAAGCTLFVLALLVRLWPHWR